MVTCTVTVQGRVLVVRYATAVHVAHICVTTRFHRQLSFLLCYLTLSVFYDRHTGCMQDAYDGQADVDLGLSESKIRPEWKC